MARLVLILGGARSGKSRFAQELAQRLGGDEVLFVATAEAGDAEMAHRIEFHRNSRPCAWETLECPLDLGTALTSKTDRHPVVLLECLTLLVSNVLLNCGDSPDPEIAQRRVETEINLLLVAVQRRTGTVLVVSGEVGMGLVPETALGRMYRDLLGRANQKLAAQAAATYLVVAGLPMQIQSFAATIEQAAADCSQVEHETR